MSEETISTEYPKSLYKQGGDLAYEVHSLSEMIVWDHVAEEAARASGYANLADAIADPLDHDGDGKPGGSVAGEQSTVRKGARAKAK